MSDTQDATVDIDVYDIVYQRQGDMDFLARVYQPLGPGPFPGVVEVHGGAWAIGSRLSNDCINTFIAHAGIMVLAIEFRIPPTSHYPDSIADVNLGARWLKAHAGDFHVPVAAVGGLSVSAGAHMLLLNALRPEDPRFTALPLPEAPTMDARLPFLALGWPIADPLARYHLAKRIGRADLVGHHDAYWRTEEAMAEGNPQMILDRHEISGPLPDVLVVQGTADENVPEAMVDRFAASYRAAGGALMLEKYDGMPHKFIHEDPQAPQALQALRSMRDFIFERSGLAASASRAKQLSALSQ